MHRSPKHRSTASDGLPHTESHVDCPACIGANLQLVELDNDFSRLPFTRASELWMALRRRSHLKDRTHETNEGYIEALKKFFGNIRLVDITAGHLKEYQDARAANSILMDGRQIQPWKRRAGHSIINHELCALGQILDHCRLWAKLKPYYFPLRTPKWSPRDVLTEEDEQELFTKAASHPEAQLAYWVACITNNTTAAGCELRGLRLKHIMLRGKGEISEIYIPEDAVKNSSSPRKIALNRTAKWAIEECYKRALKLGSCQPDHYLFPFRLKSKKYAPERPASRWFLRNSWNALRKCTGFSQLKPHDLRHQCITRLLENGVMPETVRAIAGHVTAQMMEYYSHIRAQAKYEAVLAIELNGRDRVRPGPRAMRRSA